MNEINYIDYSDDDDGHDQPLMEIIPQPEKLILLHCHSWDKEHREVVIGYWSGSYFHDGDNYQLEQFDLVPYAWEAWPTPAPYKEADKRTSKN